MSFDAISWAMSQPVGHSLAKFLLVAMADCVNGEGTENMLCFPSVVHLAERTDMDRKSVKTNLQRLRELGFIEDTGERRGQTRQVIVYRLNTPKNGPLSDQETGYKEAQISPERGPKTDAFKADERGPNFPSKGPNFPDKEAQISPERGPKTGHGTTKEPIKEPVMEPVKVQKKRVNSNFDPRTISLPDWLSLDIWEMWVKDRADRKKPVTAAAAKLQLRTLEKLREKGHDPVLVIENAIEKGWQGLYESKDGSTKVESGEGLCPIDKLLDVYAEMLPELPQPRRSLFIGGEGASDLRSRWDWVMSADAEVGERAGQRMAISTEEGVAWFRRFFGYVSESAFLLGQAGDRKWSADIGWLMNRDNFEKVLEGKYHREVGHA